MKVDHIIDILNNNFPQYLQESFDNTGSQVIFNDSKVEKILLSLDIDMPVINEAIDNKCNLIIAHHPFFFKPIKSIESSNPKSEMLLKIIEYKINLFAAHTNLDKVYSRKLNDVLGLNHKKILFETNTNNENETYGLGSLSELNKPVKLQNFLKMVKSKLSLDYLIYSGEMQKEIYKVALINGAGGNSIEKIINKNNIDCIITGDIGYHSIKFAIDSSVAVIDAGHFGTEKILLNFLQEELQDYLTNYNNNNHIQILISEKEKNPFNVYK